MERKLYEKWQGGDIYSTFVNKKSHLKGSWIYLGKLESIQVRTTVDDERTIALSPTGGTSGVAGSGASSSSLVRIVS